MLFILVRCVYVCRIMDGGVQIVPHSNQDTWTNIESYHGVLKHWFALDTKALKGRKID